METDEIYLFAILKAVITYLIITAGFLFIYTMYQYNIKGLDFSRAFSVIYEPIFYSNALILLFIILTYFIYQAKKDIDLF